MPRMGNAKDARRALNDDLKEIGSGCTRVVYLDDDEKYVYKVAFSNRSDSCNVGEHLMFEVMRQSTPWSKHCPKTRLIRVRGRVVLVMKYYPNRVSNDNAYFNKMADDLYKKSIMFDLAAFNAMADERGNFYIIDAGEGGYNDGDEFITILTTGKGSGERY